MGSVSKVFKKVTKAAKKPLSKITKGIAKGIVKAVTNFDKPHILHESSSKIISTMKGQSADSLVENEKLSIRGN